MKALRIADLKHKVVLCTMHDVVDEGGTMRLAREGVLPTWAHIEAKTGSLIGKNGYSIEQPLEQRTHKITIRYRNDLDITSAAWVYEARLKSPPRWYKVLTGIDTREDGQFITLDCRLVESSVAALPPVAQPPLRPITDAVKLPEGVKL